MLGEVLMKKLFLLYIITTFVSISGCSFHTGELSIVDGLYPFQMFYISSTYLWITHSGGSNNNEVINYELIAGAASGKNYLVDDNGFLAFGGSKQPWILMAEQEELEFTEATIRSRRFAIKNAVTGRFINVKGLALESMENAIHGQQILVSEFEKDDAYFWGINPHLGVLVGKTEFPLYAANIVSSVPNYSGAGILSLLGNYHYSTMKPSENTKGLYAVQYLFGVGTEFRYDPEIINYFGSPQGSSIFNFTFD